MFFVVLLFTAVFNSPKVQGKKNCLEKMGEVVDIMKKSSSDSGLQLAGMKVISKILEEEGPQERSSVRSDSAITIWWELHTTTLSSVIVFIIFFNCN